MNTDIRTRTDLAAADILALNFIRRRQPYVFRRHFRHGLRSHILQVLDPADVRVESDGIPVDGVRCFPLARPRMMLRIFRQAFDSPTAALDEIRRLKIVDHFLTAAFYARSAEFVVSYRGPTGYDTLLCGLQEYVAGEDLDPWHPDPPVQLAEICRHLSRSGPTGGDCPTTLNRRIRRQLKSFIRRLKRMASAAHHVPDLAGIGNILISPGGYIKLVDINNISRLHFDARIRVDDKGYPAADKSVEALFLLQRLLDARLAPAEDPLYRFFLDPGRMAAVRDLEKSALQNIGAGGVDRSA